MQKPTSDHTPAVTTAHGDRHTALLWSLLFGNFVVGTGILMPAGMLTSLAQGLAVTLSDAGSLVVVSGVLVALGAPLLAAVTSRIDRRALLVASLALYAIAHVLSALADSYAMMIVARVMIAVTAAIYTPQAAATVGALVPEERRSAAIAMVFIGWSLATVGGMPLGGYVAGHFGWRIAFDIVAVLSAIAAAAIAITLPRGVRIVPLGRAAWGGVVRSKAHLVVLLVTILNGTGQFTFLTYLNPSLKASLAADATLLTMVLAWYGVMATLGSIIASMVIQRLGASRAAHGALSIMAVGLMTWWLGANTLAVVLFAAALWGLGTFATNSIQQARLAGLAPEVTSASISLNTSAIYLGQAAGSAIGGALIAFGHLGILPLVGAGILLLALATSVAAVRYEPAMVTQSA